MNRLTAIVFRRLGRWLAWIATGRLAQFEALPVGPHEIVLLGDSITEQGIWNEWFPGRDIANRGIGGNTSAELRARMHASSLGPETRLVLILIGTNDLSTAVPHHETVENVSSIIAETRRRAPTSTIVLQSVTPRKAKAREAVDRLNGAYLDLARAARIEYLDLWPALADEDGALRQEYTLDSLHLNGNGYRAWTTALEPLIRKVIVS
jgi:lysophospholipase L1-like esterase